MRKRGSNDDVIIRRPVNDHVIKMASAKADDGPNTVRIRVIVPDIKFQTLVTFRATDTVWAAKQKLLGTSVLKSLQDGLNYGLYCLPANGKAGKFLDEERQLKEYPFPGPIGVLEFKYKKRVYRTTPPDPVRMKKLHSSSNLKAFMELVRKNDVEKISALTNKGFDPNFIDRTSGETPLSLSTSLPRPRSVMLVLVSGGAILDYRNGRRVTAVHVAVQRGNRDALMTLLDLGASPNYKDERGLTPLYHAVMKDSQAGPQCVQMLLFNRSDIGLVDATWNTELHQVCLNGRVQHLEHLLFYGADVNAQNTSGDTPLHICASHNQEECARVLLFRGANKTIRNKSAEKAFQTANTAGHTSLADVIRRFTANEVVLFQELPTYNEKRRGTISAATLRNLQRSRSNPQLSHLFQTSMVGDNPALSSQRSLEETSSSSVRAAPASLSSAYQFHPHSAHGHQHVEPGARSSILLNSDIVPSFAGDSLHNHSELVTRTVVVRRDKRGFGFILRGAKSRTGSQALLDFTPTADFPSLQYFDLVEKNSQADLAGLRSGDFLLQVGDVSVVKAAHEYVVNLIKKAGDILVLKVVHVHQPSPSQQLMTTGTDFTPGNDSMPAAPPRTIRSTWSRSVIDGLHELERLDATLDNYEVEGRKQSDQQSLRTNQDLIFTSTPSSVSSFLVHQPDGLVNGGGGGAHNATFVTHVDLHHVPAEPTHEQHQRASPMDEPEPDYDAKDVDSDHDDAEGTVLIDGRLPRPKEVVCTYGEPPTPPPLPPPSTLGFSARLQVSRAQSRERGGGADPTKVAEAKQRDEAHAALMAAVQRRRHLLDSVDAELIADSIESRVQRSKMLQSTVYKADTTSPPPAAAAPAAAAQRSESTGVQHAPAVGLLSVSDATTSSSAVTESNGGGGNFTTQAEQARLRYVRRLRPSPPPPSPAKQPPPLTKPLRSQPPPTATKSLQNGVGSTGQAGAVRDPPPPVPRRPVVVHESHNRALAAYVNGSSKVYTAAGAGTSTGGDVDSTTRAFVRLSDVGGESTTETEPSPSTGACTDRRLKVVTDDTASVLSSLSTLSTNSSGGIGAGGDGGATSPHGSPSQSSSGDSGFAKSSISTTDGAEQQQPCVVIPPPSEFATSPSADNMSSSSSSTSVQTTVPAVTALRSAVARNQSHSIVFPARTQLATQK